MIPSIPSSSSSITRGTSPTRFRRYRLPHRPKRCSKSTASHPGRGKSSPKIPRLLLLRRARCPSSVDSGELVNEPVVLLTRCGPGFQVSFPGVGDGVHPTRRATLLGADVPLRAAEPFVFHPPQGPVH